MYVVSHSTLCGIHFSNTPNKGEQNDVQFTFTSLFPSQGEDGFPGFKGDMGIKGDRVRMVAEPAAAAMIYKYSCRYETNMNKSVSVFCDRATG